MDPYRSGITEFKQGDRVTANTGEVGAGGCRGRRMILSTDPFAGLEKPQEMRYPPLGPQPLFI